jgi:DNA processing protein
VSAHGNNRTTAEVAICSLLAVSGIGPARIRALIEAVGVSDCFNALHHRSALAANALARFGDFDSLAKSASRVGSSGMETVQRCRQLGIELWLPTDSDWDVHWAADPRPPAALFVRGDRSLLTQLRVGIVGTRSASSAGREMAQRFGRELGDVGCAVVSGLASGIDANAHAGTLAAARPAPIGVVGCGLDVVYPRQHADLWRRVSEVGLMISEYRPGTRPTERSFPARNRLIAALSDVVVVVESNESGGSLITCDDAWARQKPVMAVPGNPLSPSCAGSNRLLRHVFSSEHPVIPCIETADILSVLQLEHAITAAAPDPRQPPSGLAREILDEIGWDATTTAKLVVRLGKSPGEVAVALGQLEDNAWVQFRQGQWNRIQPGLSSQPVSVRGPARLNTQPGSVRGPASLNTQPGSVRGPASLGSAGPKQLPLDMVEG